MFGREEIESVVNLLANYPLHNKRVWLDVDKMLKEKEGTWSPDFEKFLKKEVVDKPKRLYVAKAGGNSPNLYELVGLPETLLFHEEYLKVVD